MESQANSTTFIPSSWPGAFEIFKTAREATRVNIGPIIGIIVINIVVSILLARAGALGRIVSDLVSVFFGIAETMLYLACAKGKKLSLGDALSKSPTFFINYLLLSILLALATIVSLLLLIVPFFFVVPRLVLAPYYLIDKDLNALDAMKASWHASKPHAGKVWGIIGVTLVFAILCIVLIGIYFLIMYSSVFALLYFFVQRNPGSQPSADSDKAQVEA